jgi:simple sugar transport system permease protein
VKSDARPVDVHGVARPGWGLAAASGRWLFQSSLLVIFIIILAALALTTPYFFTPGNLLNIARQAAPTLIVAVGMTLVITSGGIDLSVGSLLAVTSVLSAMALTAQWNPVLVVCSMLALGIAAGLINGYFTSYQGIPAFIVTLASLSGFRGVALVLTGGYSIPIDPFSLFIGLGRGWAAGLPIPVWLSLGVVAGGYVLLNRTRFGLHVTGMGSNEEAVRRAGVNTRVAKLGVYVLSGALTALAGMVTAARLASGSSYSGIGFELDVIAAVILGGTNLFGGEGTVFGTILGTLILAMISNGLILLHVSPFYEQIIKGAILLAAIWANRRLVERMFVPGK